MSAKKWWISQSWLCVVWTPSDRMNWVSLYNRFGFYTSQIYGVFYRVHLLKYSFEVFVLMQLSSTTSQRIYCTFHCTTFIWQLWLMVNVCDTLKADVFLCVEKILLHLKLNKFFKNPLRSAGKCIATKLKTGLYFRHYENLLETHCSHRTATLQTYNDLIECDASL